MKKIILAMMALGAMMGTASALELQRPGFQHTVNINGYDQPLLNLTDEIKDRYGVHPNDDYFVLDATTGNIHTYYGHGMGNAIQGDVYVFPGR